MTAPVKTNRILALHTPEVSSMLKETDDDVEFVTDMEEPVCEGSEEHNHQQEDINTELQLFTLDFTESSQKRQL